MVEKDRSRAGKVSAGGDDFALTKIAVLKQVAHARGLPDRALHVALVYVEHCNRKAGLTFPSQETIARILHLDTRTVRRCTDALKRLGVLVPAGRRPGTRVKQYELQPDPSYKENLWPTDPSPAAAGNAASTLYNRTGKSGPLSAPDRTEESGFAKSEPDNSGHLNRTPGVFETGQGSPKEPYEEPFDEPSSTTTRDSLLGLGSKKELKEERDNLELAAQILGGGLAPKRVTRWRKDLTWYAARGIDFRAHVVPAMNEAMKRATENGEPLSVTTLRYFSVPAAQMRDLLRLAGIAVATELPPDIPTWTQADEDRDDVEFALSRMKYEATPDRVQSFMTSVRNLRERGFDFSTDIWPRIEKSVQFGIVPADVRSFQWFLEKAPARIARAQRDRQVSISEAPQHG